MPRSQSELIWSYYLSQTTTFIFIHLLPGYNLLMNISNMWKQPLLTTTTTTNEVGIELIQLSNQPNSLADDQQYFETQARATTLIVLFSLLVYKNTLLLEPIAQQLLIRNTFRVIQSMCCYIRYTARKIVCVCVCDIKEKQKFVKSVPYLEMYF